MIKEYPSKPQTIDHRIYFATINASENTCYWCADMPDDIKNWINDLDYEGPDDIDVIEDALINGADIDAIKDKCGILPDDEVLFGHILNYLEIEWQDDIKTKLTIKWAARGAAFELAEIPVLNRLTDEQKKDFLQECAKHEEKLFLELLSKPNSFYYTNATETLINKGRKKTPTSQRHERLSE